jgi:hypothetical protein
MQSLHADEGDLLLFNAFPHVASVPWQDCQVRTLARLKPEATQRMIDTTVTSFFLHPKNALPIQFQVPHSGQLLTCQ